MHVMTPHKTLHLYGFVYMFGGPNCKQRLWKTFQRPPLERFSTTENLSMHGNPECLQLTGFPSLPLCGGGCSEVRVGWAVVEPA